MKIRIRLIFLTILVFLAVFYFLKVRRDDQKTYFTDNLVVSFFQPVVNGFNGAFGFIPRIYQRYFALINTQSENETLKQAVQLLTLQNDSLKVELQQIHADAAVLNQYAYLNRALLPTRVIGYDPFMQSKTIWINAGSDKSVKFN